MCYNRVNCINSWSPENRQRRRLIYEYNLTIEIYNELFDKGCWLCGKPFDKNSRRAPHVDHDHRCCVGKRSCGGCIRGLAHQFCNQAIAKEDPNLLRTI